MRRRSPAPSRQWRWPLVLALTTIFGLLSALIGEGGIWWRLSWAALAAPLLVIIRYWPLRQFVKKNDPP